MISDKALQDQLIVNTEPDQMLSQQSHWLQNQQRPISLPYNNEMIAFRLHVRTNQPAPSRVS